ncbi:hypothetical protein [Cryobacterium sp. CG_9.6]|uniref:hypothetical protein n=1 Tax=Cryobacterium sp. CG_9.6 TaxID=2760710 RepID=UPI002475267F|nr:hypothetical protein [Cryobacterium sp. CG_9.6]MDH6237906.1 hypothetical protein [Cryobacterium sp. CG_9.6]
MPFHLGPMDETFAPARWSAPDYAREGEVSRAWLPPEIIVGHLVIQDESALVWLSAAGPDKPEAYAARIIVQDILREALAEGLSARETVEMARAAILFEAPDIVKLPELMADLRKQWGR